MNPKRHAELQRKLTLARVPKPPADLLDRIKNDIPEYLRPETERARFRRSLSFNLRVAAAFLLVISSVVATIYLIEPQAELAQMASKAPAPASVPDAATDEVQVEITQHAPAKPVMQVANVTSDAAISIPPVPETESKEERGQRRYDEVADGAVSGVSGSVVGGVVGGTAGGVVRPAEPLAIAEAAPAPDPTPAAPAPTAPVATAAAPARAAVQQTITVTSEAPAGRAESRATAKLTAGSFVREAQAADLDLRQKDIAFGISLDPNAFNQIKEALEKNQRPSAVNVEAIINYFAGGPARKLRRGVKLEVEGSPSPVDHVAQHGFLRFSIDTASADAVLPVATDAKVEIDLNGKVVAEAHPVGDSAVIGAESVLLNNLSVTGLYELTLHPNLRASDRVATVKFTYTNVADGKRRTLEQSVYARDFAKLWTRASRRHRLASLGAVWGQSLKGASPGQEVAKRAEELATQAPGDERAHELATAAAASSKLTNSGF
jgi:hypothetical protein